MFGGRGGMICVLTYCLTWCIMGTYHLNEMFEMNIISELLEMGGYLDETNWGERVGMWGLLDDLNAVRVKGDTLRMSARRLAKDGAFACYTEDVENALKGWGVELEPDVFEQFCDFVALEIENAVDIMREDLRDIRAWEE